MMKVKKYIHFQIFEIDDRYLNVVLKQKQHNNLIATNQQARECSVVCLCGVSVQTNVFKNMQNKIKRNTEESFELNALVQPIGIQ